MSKRMKRILALGIVGAMAMSMLAGCSGSTENQGAGETNQKEAADSADAENAEAKNRILNKYSIKASFFGFYAKKY